MSTVTIDESSKTMRVYLDDKFEPVDESKATYVRVLSPKGVALLKLDKKPNAP